MCPYKLMEIIKFQAKLIMIHTYNYVKILGLRKIQISKQRINLINYNKENKVDLKCF